MPRSKASYLRERKGLQGNKPKLTKFQRNANKGTNLAHKDQQPPVATTAATSLGPTDVATEQQNRVEKFKARVDAIPNKRTGWEEVQQIVSLAQEDIRLHELSAEIIRQCLRKILKGKEPKQQQVDAVERLVFFQSDTIVIAATGFGKSIIYQAAPLLTGKSTIQIVPVTSLGTDQLTSILLDYGKNASPILITADTKKAHPDTWQRVREKRFTHVLLGPEQATTPEFRSIITDPAFAAHVGIVALDELHTVATWTDFREKYTHLSELRRGLGDSVPIFGCTATLTVEQEAIAKESVGFRPDGLYKNNTKVIRICIDRPDIAIQAAPIPRGTIESFRRLWYIISDGVTEIAPGGYVRASPRSIKKTVIFLDDRNKIDDVVIYFKRELQELTKDSPQHYQYNEALLHQTIRSYHSHTRQIDRLNILEEFKLGNSTIRILVSSTSFGLGMNIPDIERVDQYDLPLSRDIGDLMQRIGRAARRDKMHGTATFHFPYWLFDENGQYRDGQEEKVRARIHAADRTRQLKEQSFSQRKTSLRHVTRGDRKAMRAKTLSGDGGNLQDVAEAGDGGKSVADEVDGSSPGTPTLAVDGNAQSLAAKTARYWTDDEVEKRLKEPLLRAMVNAPCVRKFILDHLQNDKSIPATRKTPAPPENCCFRCNPLLMLPESCMGPRRDKPPTKPKEGSKAGFVLQRIVEWCEQEANNLVPKERRLAYMPASYAMPTHIQWAIARQFNSSPFEVVVRRLSVGDGLRTAVPEGSWKRSDILESKFLGWLHGMVPKLQEDWDKERARQTRTSRIQENGNQENNPTDLTAEPLALDGSYGTEDAIERRDAQARQDMRRSIFRLPPVPGPARVLELRADSAERQGLGGSQPATTSSIAARSTGTSRVPSTIMGDDPPQRSQSPALSDATTHAQEVIHTQVHQKRARAESHSTPVRAAPQLRATLTPSTIRQPLKDATASQININLTVRR